MKEFYSSKIDAFAHILPPKYTDALYKWLPSNSYWQHMRHNPAFQLENLFQSMNRFPGYQMVMTMQAPPVETIADPAKAVELARLANDEMAELQVKYPQRFVAAMASLPMNDIDATLKEVDRAIQDLKLKGVQIYTPTNDKPLDSPEFLPLYEKMSQYDLPIYIHPYRYQDTPDYKTEKESLYCAYHIFGWPYETSIAMIRIVFSGVLAKYPNLKIIVHHNGAMVPFFESRIRDEQFRPEIHKPVHAALVKAPIDYFKMFYVDTVVRTVPALMCTYHFYGADHILFGTDQPHGSPAGGGPIQRSINGIEGMAISDAEKQMIFKDNIRKVLNQPG